MEPSRTFGRLTDEEWRELNSRADRFAATIAQNPSADWEPLLEGLKPGLRYAVLIEFIKIDLQEGWTHGRRPILADYRLRFRDLDDSSRIPTHLISEEIRIRRSNGDQFDVEEYLRTYPDQADEIRETLPGSGTFVQTTFLNLSAASMPIPKAPSLGSSSEIMAVGNYIMKDELGRGQFGKVYKAVAPGGVDVAIKVIPRAADGNEARKERGALELVKNIRHPHLLPVLAYWERDNNLYVVMELADGTLGDCLKNATADGAKTPVPFDNLIKYITEAAKALDYLHSKNLLHRDIKPANILLGNDFAKIADFGLARQQNPGATAGTFAGTPAYMAPEAWAGRFCPQSDQYSLALTYAELRLGKRLIDGQDFVAVMTQHLEMIPEIPTLPIHEQIALKRALAKQPEDRFPSCLAFAEALQRESEIVGPIPPWRKFLMPIIGGLAISVLFVGGYFASTYLNKPVVEEEKKSSTPAVAKTDPKVINEPPKEKPKDPPEIKPNNPPMPPVLIVPANYRAPNETPTIRIDGKDYPKVIQREFEGAGPVRFVLIQPKDGSGVTRSFYMQEHKVSNSLVSQFAKAQPEALPNTAWKNVSNLSPAMNLTITEAMAIAQWLGGQLPSPNEWDLAAGFFETNRPSLTTQGKPAIGLALPRSVNVVEGDRNSLELYDLAGNGREFTNVVLNNDGTTRPATALEDPRVNVVLRGRMHTLSTPLTMEILEAERKLPQTQFFGKGSPYTTFRVLIPLP